MPFDSYDGFEALLKKYGFDTPYCDSYVGQGWWPLLEELLTKLQDTGIVLAQIKEKFGFLRIYVNGHPDNADVRARIASAIQEAEEKSAVTCEECGAAGKRRSGGWVKVRCDACQTAHEART